MRWLQYARVSLAELLAGMTLCGLSFAALLYASEITNMIVGGILLFSILAAVAIAVVPGAPGRWMCMAFAIAALIHASGSTHLRGAFPTMTALETIWEAAYREKLQRDNPFADSALSPLIMSSAGQVKFVRLQPLGPPPPPGRGDFIDIGVQVVSLWVGLLAALMTRGVARAVAAKEILDRFNNAAASGS